MAFVDKAIAHNDRKPMYSLWDVGQSLMLAVDLLIELGSKYVRILSEPHYVERGGLSPDDLRSLYGKSWLRDAGEIPAGLLE